MAKPTHEIYKQPEYKSFDDFYEKRLKNEPSVVQFDISDNVLTVDRKSYENRSEEYGSYLIIDEPIKGFIQHKKLSDYIDNIFYDIVSDRAESIFGKHISKEETKLFSKEFLDFSRRYNEKTMMNSNQTIFLKKIIHKMNVENRLKNVEPEIIDDIQRVASVNSSAFLLELFSSLWEKHAVSEFSKCIGTLKKDDLSSYVNRPYVMLKPWNHQKEAFDSWKNNSYKGIVEMATATGKTLVGMMAIEDLYKTAPSSSNLCVRIFAHSRSLLSQWKVEILNKMALKCKIYDRENFGKPISCDRMKIYFHTLQSAYQNPELYKCDLMIIDEVHHTASKEFKKALSAESPRKLGLSATVDDFRLSELEEYLGGIVYRFDLEKAIQTGILPRYSWETHTVYLSIEEDQKFEELTKNAVALFTKISSNIGEIKRIYEKAGWKKYEPLETMGDFIYLMKRLGLKDIRIPDEWKTLQSILIQRRDIINRSRPKLEDAQKLALKYLKEKKKIVLFLKNINSCNELAAELKKESDNVFVVHSELKGKDPVREIADFKASEYGILIGAEMLNEGHDIPDAEIGINVASSRSRLEMTQRLGRILRKGKGNKKPVFHHYIAIPKTSEYIIDDYISYFEQLSWTQDTSLKMGSIATIAPDSKEYYDRYENTFVKNKKHDIDEIIPLENGSVRIKMILQQFENELPETQDSDIRYPFIRMIRSLYERNKTHNNSISEEEWAELVRNAFGFDKEAALNLPGYWWILVLGIHDAGNIARIFAEYYKEIDKVSINECPELQRLICELKNHPELEMFVRELINQNVVSPEKPKKKIPEGESEPVPPENLKERIQSDV